MSYKDLKQGLMSSDLTSSQRAPFGVRNKSFDVLRYKKASQDTQDLRRVLLRRDRHQLLISEYKQGNMKKGYHIRGNSSVLQMSSKTATQPSFGVHISSDGQARNDSAKFDSLFQPSVRDSAIRESQMDSTN